MGALHTVCAITTQGKKNESFVESYKLSFSSDKSSWSVYQEQNIDKVWNNSTLIFSCLFYLFIFLNRCANRPNRMNLWQSHVCFWFINCAKKRLFDLIKDDYKILKVLIDEPLSSISFKASRTAVIITFLRGFMGGSLPWSPAGSTDSNSGLMGLSLFSSDPLIKISSPSAASGVEGLADELELDSDPWSLSISSAKLHAGLSLPRSSDHTVSSKQFSRQCRNSVVLSVAVPRHWRQGE